MPAFVGRADALATVTDALGQPPALVLVEGEAGIGKTRLVQECLESAPLADHTVLMVECPPLADPVPFAPLVDGLRRLHEHVNGVQLSPLGGALRPLFPEWGHDLPPPPEPMEDARQTRGRVYRALTELVDRLGVDLLVFEDAHWADTASLEWLVTMTTAGTRDSRSVAVTSRPQDVPSGSLLRQLTSRMPSRMGRVRIVLEPLDITGIQQLVASMLDIDEVSPEFASLLHKRTGGLPLAVEESLRLLCERGDLSREGGEWARRALEEIRVPPTVRDSVHERVDRLDATARRVLEATAVLAAPADEALLVAVAGLEPQAGRHGVTAGLRSGLLCEAGPGRVAFRHQLAAEAVAEAISANERSRLHRRAGEALKTGDPVPVMRLARHFWGAGDITTWSRYAETAAETAEASGDLRTAVKMLYDLLTTARLPTRRRVAVARRLGQITATRSESLGEMEAAVCDALRAVLAGEGLSKADRGEIRLLLGWLLLQADDDAAYAEIETAFADLRHRPAQAARAALLLALPRGTPGWPAARHREWLERANGLLPRLPPGPDQLGLLLDRAHILLRLGDERGWQAAAEIPRSAPARAEELQIARGLLNVALCAMEWGRYDDARRQMAEAAAFRFPRVLEYARAGQALLDYYTGAWAGLTETVEQLAGSEETRPRFQLEARLIQALLSLASGGRADAERRLRDVSRRAAEGSQTGSAAVLSAAALGRLHLADDAPAEALLATEASMEAIAGKGMWQWATGIAPVHIDTLVAAGELTRAHTLVTIFSDGLADQSAPAPIAALLTCQAIVTEAGGDLPVAARLFAQAAAGWAGLPRPYDELLALERQGGCLLAAGEQDRGVAVLSETRKRMQDLGARWDAGRVARLLRRHGVEVPRTWRSGPRGYGEQLSPREREVVALVAQGMTNPQVGRQLHLSPKTVGKHLSSAMRKLGVSTRTSAAVAAAETGVVPPASAVA